MLKTLKKWYGDVKEYCPLTTKVLVPLWLVIGVEKIFAHEWDSAALSLLIFLAYFTLAFEEIKTGLQKKEIEAHENLRKTQEDTIRTYSKIHADQKRVIELNENEIQHLKEMLKKQ